MGRNRGWAVGYRCAPALAGLSALALAGALAGHAAASSPGSPAAGQKLSGVAHATVSPDGKRMAFQRKTANGWRIYTSNLSGTDLKAVSSGPKDDVEPSWRADGALIAFSSNRAGNYDLYAVRPDGQGLRQLTKSKTDERNPQWSPRPFGLFQPSEISGHTVPYRSRKSIPPSDLQLLEMLAKGSTGWDSYRAKFDIKPRGQYYKLLFVEGAGDRRQIATMRENGAFRQTLSTSMPGAHYSPTWERGAGEIGFLRRVGKDEAAYLAEYPNTMDNNPGTGKPQFGIELKTWRQTIQRVGTLEVPASQLSWTPNGEYLAVASSRGVRLLPRPGAPTPSGSVLVHPLPVTAATPQKPGIAPHAVGWLPDGRTAVVTVQGESGPTLMAHSFTEPLLDVTNLRDFSYDLKQGDKTLLGMNYFVAAGNPRRQMFHAYEETDYADLPIFVTTDSLLHLNHLVFDYLLRGVETEHLMPEIIRISGHYLRQSLMQRNTATSPAVRQAATGNAAFFAVAARLALGAVRTGEIKASASAKADDPLATDRETLRNRTIRRQEAQLKKWTPELSSLLLSLPPDVKRLADAELALISKHGGMEQSPIFGGALTGVGDPAAALIDTRIDYSDFIPRGHYSRTEILRRYFLVTRWLSGAPFRHTADGARRSLLIMAATDTPTRTRLNRVLGVMTVFVGDADDADMASYTPLARQVFGGTPAPADLADNGKMDAFVRLAKALPAPRIAASRGGAFRFLPQPYTPDAEIMQGLVYDRNPPDVGTEEVPRYFALGLDVMAVLGSDRARQILDNTKFGGTFFNFDLKETEYANYDAQYNALRSQFGKMSAADWNRNLYTRTLHALRPLLQPTTHQKFKFTQSQAWVDKNLNTALATWAELKHDTMPKLPVAIEAGSEGGISEAPIWTQPRGFVEPAQEVFQRLGALVAAERAALAGAGYLSPAFKQRLDTFEALITMIARLEKKQQAGQALTPREVEQLRFYGAYQEHLTYVTAEGEGGSMEGNDMAIIADVSIAYSTRLKKQLVLQEGVGRALPLYVAVERNGRRELTRGAVFTYYEFTQPAENRLTDEKWRDLLDSEEPPTLPAWTSSFVSRVGGDD